MLEDKELIEQKLSEKRVFNGALINVDHVDVLLPDGNTALREVVRHRGAVAIVPVDDIGCVTLVRQFRVPLGRVTEEIPAGKLDHAQEEPLSAAQRELEQETGLRAAHWQQMLNLATTPGFCDERIRMYLATGLTKHTAHTDDDEFLHVCRIPLEVAVRKVMAGEYQDGKTALGILMAARMLSSQDTATLYTQSSIQRMTGALSSRPAENNAQ